LLMIARAMKEIHAFRLLAMDTLTVFDFFSIN